jgi:hypothetical protein
MPVTKSADAVESSRPEMGEQVEVVVGPGGEILVPLEVREALGLRAGELLSVLRQPLSLRLEIYGEFLADNWEAVSPRNRWHYLEAFLSRPLASMGEGGDLNVPPGLLPVQEGDRVILETVRRGLCHELFLYRIED